MKVFFAVLLLILLMGCASTDGGNGDGPQVKYGGTMRTTVRSSHGM